MDMKHSSKVTYGVCVCVCENFLSVIHFHWAKGTCVAIQERLFSMLEYSDWLFLCTFVCVCVLM